MTGVKQPLLSGAVIATIKTESGETVSVVADYDGHVDRYNVKEGDTVKAKSLLGAIKYAE